MRLLILLVALLPLVAAGETAYVTDSLRLRMYSDAELTNVVETLQSGDAFEVLSRNRQTALIRLGDGRQGYVAAGYIVDEKPAKLIVAESQAETARLTAELDALRASFAEPEAVISGLRDESAALQASLDTALEQRGELEAENRSLANRLSRYRYSLPYAWVAGAMLICAISGFFFSLWWLDRQSRKRHGGIRVY